MAKDPNVNDPLAVTQKQETPEDKVNPKGVGLKQSEWDEIEQLAKEIDDNMTGHKLAVVLLRRAVALYKDKKIKLTKKTQTTIE